MGKYQVGDQAADFVFDTPDQTGIHFKDIAKNDKNIFVFLRYLGCSLCQLDIALFKKEYENIVKKGGNLYIVLQSPQSTMLPVKDQFPFPFVCDPEGKLYELFGIEPAPSKEKMIGLKTMKKVGQAKLMGFSHGAYEGNELQLPAAFIFKNDGTITYAHYGKTVDDAASPKTIVKLLG
ncbi:MAG: AhpC/TSA family protein [Erysipelotrichaceae bacterium]|jgi:peroxiredoxin|nr:AhpC/TSA family protein [Erysipelotrichaceae bacterium]